MINEKSLTKRKIKVILIVLLVSVFLLFSMLFGGKNQDASGKWYADDGACLELFEQGVWIWKDESETYGGIWELKNRKFILEDILANHYQIIISEDEAGEYIVFEDKICRKTPESKL